MVKGNVYSPFKAAHHAGKIAQLRSGEQIVPSFVEIMWSDLCNHNCHFCAYRMENYTSNKWFGEKDPLTGIVNNNPNRMIPYEKVIEIIDDLKDMGVKAIEVTGGGEPTVHPKHREMLSYALEKGFEIGLVTNGTLLRDGMDDIISQMKWVRVSVDAAKASTYARMREVPEAFFDKTIENIKKIVEAKKRRGSDLVVGVGFVVTRENYSEICHAVKLFSGIGVDNVRLSAMFSKDNAGYFDGIFKEISDAAADAVREYSTPEFRVFNLVGDRLQDLEQENPDYEFCAFQQFQCIIGGDQNVYRCCNTAYNPVGYLGTIKDKRFKDFWLSKEKMGKIEEFNAKSCERCMFNNKNRYINYLIEEDPPHVNFV